LPAPSWVDHLVRPAVQHGGTLRVNLSGTDVGSLDPALAYDAPGWQIESATCAKLLNFPDRTGSAGLRLVPEVAARFPTVSSDGRTYRFTIRHGFRFNTGERVTAASFAHAINRALNPRLASPGVKFMREIVGAEAVRHGRRTSASGVSGTGAFQHKQNLASAERVRLRLAELVAAPTECS
jgi:ABC-type oligopeptide transport system substrate-binding subunit